MFITTANIAFIKQIDLQLGLYILSHLFGSAATDNKDSDKDGNGCYYLLPTEGVHTDIYAQGCGYDGLHIGVHTYQCGTYALLPYGNEEIGDKC